MKKILALMAVILLLSCKSKAVVTSVTEPIDYMKAKKIIDNHYKNKSDYSTLYIKANAKFSDGRQNQNVTAEIKIKKDEQILISIRFLGITMAKAPITPSSVSYYEKIKGTYFEGDFRFLSEWLGTDLDYNKIQNMLTGEVIDDLNKGKYIETLVEKLYCLNDLSSDKTKKTFYFNPDDFTVNKQEINQTVEDRKIQVAYSDIVAYKEAKLPTDILITTYQPRGKTEINLKYNTITFNEKLSFPYSIPDGYDRIIIK